MPCSICRMDGHNRLTCPGTKRARMRVAAYKRTSPFSPIKMPPFGNHAWRRHTVEIIRHARKEHIQREETRDEMWARFKEDLPKLL